MITGVHYICFHKRDRLPILLIGEPGSGCRKCIGLQWDHGWPIGHLILLEA